MLVWRLPNYMILSALAVLVSACDGILPSRRQPALQAATSVESVSAQAARPAAKRKGGVESATPVAPEEAVSAFDQIRRSLRVLVAAEQGFYAENGAYTEDLTGLGFRPSGESQVKFLWATPAGWAASGSHPAMPGRDCVVFVGKANAPPTTLRYTRSGREGVVVCDLQSEARTATAAGGSGPSAPPAADTASALDAVNPSVQMKVDLRNLAKAQDAYYAIQGIYSRRPELLQLQFGWQRGVTVTVLDANRTSWTARATHASRPGESCVVWFGSPPTRPVTQADRKKPDRQGVPVCDG